LNRVLITGGAGFIGSNVAEHFLSRGSEVLVFDNLSRPGGGAKRNIERLLGKHEGNPGFRFFKGDVRDFESLKEAVDGKSLILHVAAQTAMTTSIHDPIEDFETNARGTLNVLEAARDSGSDPTIIYTSTNKVYGDLTRQTVELAEKETRWDFADEEFRNGVDEDYPLDYEGPYGCSKGIGDAYCLDYARTFGLKTVVFRMSGVYGWGQYPTEDQGWVAWFIRQAIGGSPVAIFGDGKQVRDILFISDLIDAFVKASENIEGAKGEVFNIGGGRANSISILELLELLKNDLGIGPSKVTFEPWRRADQKVYISNTGKAKEVFGWELTVGKEEGVKRLHEWMKKELRES